MENALREESGLGRGRLGPSMDIPPARVNADPCLIFFPYRPRLPLAPRHALGRRVGVLWIFAD